MVPVFNVEKWPTAKNYHPVSLLSLVRLLLVESSVIVQCVHKIFKNMMNNYA